MEKGEILAKAQQLPFNVVRGVREAMQRRADSKYGTLAERQAAYTRLYEQCEALFAAHADKVGTLKGVGDNRYQRLILEGMPGVQELIIDKDVSGNNDFSIVGMNTTMGALENPVIYDRRILVVTPTTGTFHTSHSETHYPPNFNPRDDMPYYKDSQTKERPLAANMAHEWANQITPELVPIQNHILMSSATYEGQAK